MTTLALLQETPWLLYTLIAVFSLLIGSFLNVVIHRLPLMQEQVWIPECRALLKLEAEAATAPEGEPLSLWGPRSRCPACGHSITALENIPVISWLFLRGHCSACKTSIPLRYPLVELLTAALSLLVVWHFGPTPQALAGLVLTWGLIPLSFIDIDRYLLPDEITLPWLWMGLLLSLTGLFTNPIDSIIGAVAGYLSLWLVYQAFKLVTGKEGMGYGDFKLLALFGAWLGWQVLPVIVLLSSVVGVIIGLSIKAITREDRSIPIPFGPYLAVAGFITLLWGDQLMALWLGSLNPPAYP